MTLNKDFTNALCNSSDNDRRDASGDFQKEYYDELVYVAGRRLHKPFPGDLDSKRDEKIATKLGKHKTEKTIEYGNLKIEPGYQLSFTEDIMDAYTFLVEQIIKKICNSYNAQSSLDNFIKQNLFGGFIVTDWIRKTKGSIQYVPKYIKDKGETFVFVVKEKLKSKNKEEILIELENEYPDVDSHSIYNEVIQDEGVRNYLLKRGVYSELKMAKKMGVLHQPEIDSLDVKYDGEKEFRRDLKDDGDLFAQETKLEGFIKNLALDNNKDASDIDFFLQKIKDDVFNFMSNKNSPLFNDDELTFLKVYFSLDLSEEGRGGKKPKEANEKILKFLNDGSLNRGKRLGVNTVFDLTNFINKCYDRFYIGFAKKYSNINKKIARQYLDEYFAEFFSSS